MLVAPGIVERCTPKRISGWVAPAGDANPDVLIKVNGLEVARTVASKPTRHDGVIRNYGFSRVIGELWKYLGPQDAVTFECGGETLPIAGYGFTYFHGEGAESKFDELAEAVGKGYIFDKKGHLGVPLHKRGRWLRLFFSVYAKLRQELIEKFGYEPFVAYGTLLGAIRQGDFLNHDNDVDLVYISKHTDPVQVRIEYVAICRHLIDLGYRGLLTKHGFAIKSPVRVDLNFAWFNPQGMFQASFGYHGPELKFSRDFGRMKRARLGKYRVRVPRNSEAILEHLYGPGWKVPDPGFSHYSRSRKFDRSYWATVEELASTFWRQYYMHQSEIGPPSRFAQQALGAWNGKRCVVDLGCGGGADTQEFARQGHTAFGIDIEPAAIALATRQASLQDVGNCTFVAADAASARDCGPPLDQALGHGEKIAVFGRCFFSSISEGTEESVMKMLVQKLEHFDLAIEVVADRPTALPELTEPPYHRKIDETRLIEKLQQIYGLTIKSVQRGTATALYKNEEFESTQILAGR